jgi:hypothetical protein
MVAHNINPRCPGDSELCGYLDREWNSTPHMLGRTGKGGDKKPTRAVRSPVPSVTKMVRPVKHRLRIPFL